MHLVLFHTTSATSDNMLYDTASLAGTRTQLSETSLGGRAWLSITQVMSPKLALTSAVSTLRSTIQTERTASTLRIPSPTQSHQAKLPTVFRRKRQPAVAHKLSPQVNAGLHAQPRSARSRKLLRSEVSNIIHVDETY